MPIILFSLTIATQFVVKIYYETPLSLFGMIGLAACIHLAKRETTLRAYGFYFLIIITIITDTVLFALNKTYFSTIGILVLAFLEELFFRYYLDGALLDQFGEIWSAAAGVLIFAIVHMPRYGFTRFMNYIILILFSIFSIFIKRKNGNIFFNTLIHYLINVFALSFGMLVNASV